MTYIQPGTLQEHGYEVDENFPAEPSEEMCRLTMWLMPCIGDNFTDAIATWEEVEEYFEDDPLWDSAYEYLLGDFKAEWLTPLKKKED